MLGFSGFHAFTVSIGSCLLHAAGFERGSCWALHMNPVVALITLPFGFWISFGIKNGLRTSSYHDEGSEHAFVSRDERDFPHVTSCHVTCRHCGMYAGQDS